MTPTQGIVCQTNIRKEPSYWGRWFWSIGDGTVKATDLNVFYQFGGSLNDLSNNIGVGMAVKSLCIHLPLPQQWLETFLFETKALSDSLPDSRRSAENLLKHVKDIIEDIPRNWERAMTQVEVITLLDGRREFEANFEREHRNLDVFTVTPKGIYNTRLLVESPEKKFPEALRPLLPAQAIYDFQQAGRCLAFEVPTACAFHICRGTESIMLAYYELLTTQPWTLKQHDWGAYITQLGVNNAPKQITTRLDEIRALNRNAYIHPDINVTLDDAPTLFELCTGVVSLMLQEMKRLKP